MKDIGKIFENKLNDGKKKPSKNVWEKINTSLDTEKQRKKMILYRWIIAGGLASLFMLFLFFKNDSVVRSNSPKPENNVPAINQMDISSDPAVEKARETNENKGSFESSKEDATIVENEIEENTAEFSISNDNLQLSEKEKSSKIKTQIQPINSVKKSKKTGSHSEINDENLIVSKNYYYYNSKNDKTIVTKNKNEIDSLIGEQHKSLDSVTTPETDKPDQ